MNILLIGNGFDLAHGLPTTYMDFLFFCHSIKQLIEDNELKDIISENYKDYLKWLKDEEKIILDADINKDLYIQTFILTTKGKLSKRNTEIYNGILDDFVIKSFWGTNKDYKLIKEILYLIHSNFWIYYFLQCNMHGAENWIDFESEISKVIKSITDTMHGLETEFSLYDKVSKWSNNYLKDYFSGVVNITYKELRDRLLLDLNKLIRVFEIYLASYVQNIKIQRKSLDMGFLCFDFLLSFNYTNTCLELYKEKISVKDLSEKHQYDFIHGKADIENTIETNSMVLGIDEYLGKKKRNKQVEFIAFKKYFQRIHKGTGCKYKEWSTIIKNDSKKIHNLYIFGHSLDVTDKDILREFILNNNVRTTIYYRNLDQKGQQIANLVKVIGQDELIKRTGGGSSRTIEFKQQQDMKGAK